MHNMTKATYVKPGVERLGSVATLTTGGSINGKENNGMPLNNNVLT